MTAMDAVRPIGSSTIRRRFIGALMAASILFSLTGGAAQSWAQGEVPRIGILILSKDALTRATYQPFLRVLGERGWHPGKNVILEYRFAGGERLRFDDAVDELVALNVDIVVAFSAPATRAAYAAAGGIPIVALDYTNDPVAVGYANRYSRPGKNLTGVFLDAPERFFPGRLYLFA